MERTPEQLALHSRLVQATLAKRGAVLTEIQQAKFETACWKTIDENEYLNLDGYLIATNIYLNFILEFPELVL